MNDSIYSASRKCEHPEIVQDSTSANNKEISEKKTYTSPTLKRYTSPKLRKHKSYKDITMLFAVLPPIPPTSP